MTIQNLLTWKSNEITILEFAEEIIKLTGTTQKIIFKPLPKDDPFTRRDFRLGPKISK